MQIPSYGHVHRFYIAPHTEPGYAVCTCGAKAAVPMSLLLNYVLSRMQNEGAQFEIIELQDNDSESPPITGP